MSYFKTAVARWQQIIVSDLPSVDGASWGFSYGVVDDVRISVAIRPIDGDNRVLGQAGWDQVRQDTWLPWRSHLEIDTFDVDRIAADGRLIYAIEHEMLHALGFNATLWSYMGLLNSSGNYIGEHGLYAYRMLTGNQSAAFVPTSGSHLSESVFGTELMTPEMIRPPGPISVVTIGILEDMGYKVNYSAADPYVLPPPAAGGVLGGLEANAVHDGAAGVASGDPLMDWLIS
jgi:hypothetical protein